MFARRGAFGHVITEIGVELIRANCPNEVSGYVPVDHGSLYLIGDTVVIPKRGNRPACNIVIDVAEMERQATAILADRLAEADRLESEAALARQRCESAPTLDEAESFIHAAQGFESRARMIRDLIAL